MGNQKKNLLPFLMYVLFLIQLPSLTSQSILETLKSGNTIYVTFNQNGSAKFPKVFGTGFIYEVSLSNNEKIWYNSGYKVEDGRIINRTYRVDKHSGEPNARNPEQGDVCSFTLFGAGFAVDSFGQVYSAGISSNILGMARTTQKISVIKYVCIGDYLPYGWVITNTKDVGCNASKGNPGTPKWELTKIDGMGVYSPIQVCTLDNIPRGWVVIDVIPDCKCCKDDSSFKEKQWKLKKIGGLPKGTIETVCASDKVPWGWKLISTNNNCQCCTGNTISPNTSWNLEKL